MKDAGYPLLRPPVPPPEPPKESNPPAKPEFPDPPREIEPPFAVLAAPPDGKGFLLLAPLPLTLKEFVLPPPFPFPAWETRFIK